MTRLVARPVRASVVVMVVVVIVVVRQSLLQLLLLLLTLLMVLLLLLLLLLLMLLLVLLLLMLLLLLLLLLVLLLLILILDNCIICRILLSVLPSLPDQRAMVDGRGRVGEVLQLRVQHVRLKRRPLGVEVERQVFVRRNVRWDSLLLLLL